MSDEKTEEPTDKKLEDARQKGQVPVSKDLARLVTLVAIAEMAFVTEPLWRSAMEALVHLSIMRIGQPFLPALQELLMSATILLLLVFAACFLVGVVVGVAGHWGQFGILVSPEALTPSFDKLNPVNGFKQLFSKKKLTELLETIFKSSLIGFITYLLVRDELPNIINLSSGEPKDVYLGFITILRSVFHVLIVLTLLLAAVDFGIQKYFHKKELMMDMEEIKREYKENEGDPMVKGERKRLAREWSMSGPVAQTKQANSVVVNPTHFAVAMFYDAKDAPVPVVLAKGKDETAQAMIECAKECGIPVIRHVWLARTLYATCKEEMVVPRSSYESVAYVYAVVRELEAAGETHRTVELESHGEPPRR
ncbi:MAG: type III secretion system export apparatus subunit SctU [Noviherbaspirillum sp.]